MVHYGAANRDEERLPDPDRFDVAPGRPGETPRLRQGDPRLPRRAARPPRAEDRAADAARAVARAPARAPATRTTGPRSSSRAASRASSSSGTLPDEVAIVTGGGGRARTGLLARRWRRQATASSSPTSPTRPRGRRRDRGSRRRGARRPPSTSATWRRHGGDGAGGARTLRPDRRARQQRGVLHRDRQEAVRRARRRRVGPRLRRERPRHVALLAARLPRR